MDFKCPICYNENCTEYVILKCKHEICLNCVLKSKKHNIDTCSLCREKINIPEYDDLYNKLNSLCEYTNSLKTINEELVQQTMLLKQHINLLDTKILFINSEKQNKTNEIIRLKNKLLYISQQLSLITNKL